MKCTLFMVFLLNSSFVFAVKNNVCKNKLDYLFKMSGCWYDPDLDSNTTDIIARHGYPVSVHRVTTEDGFILKLIRIPHNGTNENAIRQPIFLQHGLLQNSAIWVDLGNKSLAFVLSNLGYDVWMGNTRGTIYSNEHVKYKETDKEFWDHTLDTFGHYDIPAAMEYIFKTTNQKSIYVGHSQGTTISFIYASENKTHAEEYVKGLVLIAPVAYAGDLPMAKYLTPVLEPIFRMLHNFGVNYIGSGQYENQKMLTRVCLQTPLQMDICKALLEMAYGKDVGNQWSPDLIPVLFKYLEDRESILPLIQYFQLANSNKFEAFNYGKNRNMEIYGQTFPKQYDLTKISIPVYMFYGVNDMLAIPKNVFRVYDELQCPKKLIQIGSDEYAFNHNHFVYSNKVEEEFYSKLLPLIDELKG